MRILLLGRTETLLSAAECFRAAGHSLAGVITARAAPESKKGEDDFRALADAAGAPFLLAQRLDERADRLVQLASADVVLSMNWVSVIHQAFIDRFRFGVLNAHFGDLPRYRGNAVPNWALISEEREVVLTVHGMLGGELDAGPIYGQARMEVSLDTTIRELTDFMGRSLPTLLLTALERLAKGSGPLVTKSASEDGFRCYPRLPRDGRIDWTLTAREIHALVRASGDPLPGAFTFYRDAEGKLRRLVVWKSRLVETPSADRAVPGHVLLNDKTTGESWVMTGSGAIALGVASHDDSREMFEPGKVWKSIRVRLGLEIESEVASLRSELESLRSQLEGQTK